MHFAAGTEDAICIVNQRGLYPVECHWTIARSTDFMLSQTPTTAHCASPVEESDKFMTTQQCIPVASCLD